MILLMIIGLYLPNYWQTRMVMEKQLQGHLVENSELVSNRIERDDLLLLGSKVVQQKINEILRKYLQQLSAESIYIFNDKGILLAVAGNRENAIKSLMLHSFQLKGKEQLIINPAFEDSEGEFYLSVFKQLCDRYYLGLSANAEFLKDLAQLRRQKSFLKINEEGTEAAAATVVIMDRTGGGTENHEIYINFDSPYIFLILEKRSNTILFCGKIINPLI